MERVMLYPFSSSSFALLKLVEQMDEYLVSEIVCTKAHGADGDDVGKLLNLEDMGYKISTSFDRSLENIDTIIVLISSVSKDNVILKNIDKAIRNGKRIVIHSSFKFCEELRKLASENCYQLTVLGDNTFATGASSAVADELITPIICVGSLLPTGYANEIAVDLTNALRKADFNVLTVATDKNLLIDDMYTTIPDFFYGNHISEIEKIEQLRYWLISLQADQRPDFIIATIPGAMMVFDDYIASDYCVYPFLFTSAIHPDYSILDISYSFLNNDFLLCLADHFKHRYTMSLDYAVFSNMSIDFSETRESHSLTWHYASKAAIQKAIEKSSAPNISIPFSLFHDRDYIYAAFEDILSKFCAEENANGTE